MQLFTKNDSKTVKAIQNAAHRLTGSMTDYDPLMEKIGDSRFVLIGEASHGTYEFYEQRAEITKRLITEKGFNAIAVEADFPDAYRINRYIRNISEDSSSNEALGDFKRFPTWMWRNTVMLDFVNWLRKYNDTLSSDAPKVGFYGLDLYSLFSSIEAVLNYLDTIDPEAAQRARDRYSCFDHYGEDSQSYGYATSFGMGETCEDEVVSQLMEMQRQAADYARRDGRIPEDEFFFAEQNARLVVNAEEYYRSMFRGRVSSWNLRDSHMVETLGELADHLTQRVGREAKIVVWAHNSHLGDARATYMGDIGEHNVGQLVRQRYGQESYNIGFSTYTGTVTAASNWDAPAQRKQVRKGLPESYEALFETTGIPNFFLNLRESNDAVQALSKPRLERAIGVIYRPETERASHYFDARLPEQFDTIIHLNETQALKPLERNPEWTLGEAPEAAETYPFGV